MKGFIKLIKIAGVNFPIAASLIQIVNELEASQLEEKLNRLEDPISHLHDDIPDLSRVLFTALNGSNTTTLEFRHDVYDKYSRAFAVLDSEEFIVKHNQAGSKYPFAVTISDETFIVYLFARFENKEKMDKLVNIVDSCEVGKWLDGNTISEEVELPVFVVQAVFKIFESKGFGFVSKTIGTSSYLANA